MARKAPAFQLYVDDFLAGTWDLSAEEVGVYIRLLCMQWSRGRLTDRQIRSAGGSPEAVEFVLREKFVKDEEGNLYNRRMEDVRNLGEVRKQSASKGGKQTASKRQANVNQSDQQNASKTTSKREAKGDSKIQASHSHSHSHSHSFSPSHSERENLARSRHLEDADFVEVWESWRAHLAHECKPLNPVSEEEQLYRLEEFETADAIEAVRYSIQRGAKNLILNGDHRGASQAKGIAW